ncbi:DUF4232 domain-containing protein [Microbacterium sp. P04]|uniref:DUF4232 domain-containing protein n=1 Tax=Microbacterium sp. P04 TaxID=3366947 RepID=UPI003746C93C
MLIAAALAGALWLLSGYLNVVAASNVYAARVVQVLVPTPTNARFWSLTQPWAFLALLLAGVSVAAVVFVVLGWVSRRGAPGFAAAWFASVAGGAVVGLFIDGIGVLGSVEVVGWRAVLYTTVDYAVVGAYWGLVQGWIPAIVASRRSANPTPAPAPTAPRWPWAVAVAALVAFAVTGTVGSSVTQAAAVEAQAQADAETQAAADQYLGMGAVPDPDAVGTAPLLTAPTAVPRDPSWCTPEQASVFPGTNDGATGHRGLSIRLMNFSDAPCVVEGYPDVAFGDQNGHALNVTVERGSSFMTSDFGPQPIEVPAGGYAIAYIGWDANATAGALVASTVLTAQVPGDPRSGSTVSLDIIEGSTVKVTAWQLDQLGPTDGGEG